MLDLTKRVYRHAQRAREKHVRRKRLAVANAVLNRQTKPFRVHVGCGTVRFDNWINIDAEQREGAADLLWNVLDGLPLPSDSAVYIYNEHLLEHLSVEQGVAFLKECRRTLRPGGVLRIAVPPLEESVRQYYENDWRDQPWLAKYGYSWIQTRAEMINVAFRYWGHQWLYDREELHRRLSESGFRSIADAAIGQSVHEELRGRETRAESTLICEATK